MKRTVVFLLSCLLIALSFSGCTQPTDPGEQSTAPVNPEDQAKAYFVVFQELYDEDTALNGKKYLAIDLTGLKLSHPAPLVDLIQEFCDRNKLELLQGTFESLQGAGYINRKDLYFEDGMLFVFEDKSLSNIKLVTSAHKWCAGDGARGSDYTVEKTDGSWQVTERENRWVS